MAELLNPVNKEWVERIAANSWNNLREKYISPSAKWVFRCSTPSLRLRDGQLTMFFSPLIVNVTIATRFELTPKFKRSNRYWIEL